MKQLLTTLIIFTLSSSAVLAETKFSANFKILPTSWTGNNDSGGQDFEAEATQISIGLGFQQGKLYGGLSIQGAEFDFTDPAPAQETDTSRLSPSNVTIEHGESDLLIGYYFWPRVSIFADIKSVVDTWKDSDYEMKYSGLGLGVSGYLPVDPKWIVYGSFGFLSRSTVESNDSKIGSATGTTLDFGMTYLWHPKLQAFAGLKLQGSTLDFDNGNTQTHGRGGLYAGVQAQIF